MNLPVIFSLVMFIQMEAGDWKAARPQQYANEKQCKEAGQMFNQTYKNVAPGAIQHVWKCIKLTSKVKGTAI